MTKANKVLFITQEITPYVSESEMSLVGRNLPQAIQEKGYTLIATKLYLKKGKAKLEIALAKGKNIHDKRETIKKRDDQREIAKAIKDHINRS